MGLLVPIAPQIARNAVSVVMAMSIQEKNAILENTTEHPIALALRIAKNALSAETGSSLLRRNVI
jgi:hypothetical protein